MRAASPTRVAAQARRGKFKMQRRTPSGRAFRFYASVRLELRADDRFMVRGRNADMVEVAGKRASLADLTQRLLRVPGVQDAVVFQPDTSATGLVQRVAALAVAGRPARKRAPHVSHMGPRLDTRSCRFGFAA